MMYMYIVRHAGQQVGKRVDVLSYCSKCLPHQLTRPVPFVLCHGAHQFPRPSVPSVLQGRFELWAGRAEAKESLKYHLT